MAYPGSQGQPKAELSDLGQSFQRCAVPPSPGMFPGSRMLEEAWLLTLGRFATPWTLAHHAPLSMGFSRQEYWSRFAMLSSRGSSQPRDRT